MTWVLYAVSTIALWALWGFLGKMALKTTPWVQGAILYGVAAVAAGLIAVALGQRPASWAPSSIWLTVIAASCGGAGLITFYMALERGKASLVLPLIGLYPVVVAVLSVSFLGERLGAVQIGGIVLAVAGGVLLSAGG